MVDCLGSNVTSIQQSILWKAICLLHKLLGMTLKSASVLHSSENNSAVVILNASEGAIAAVFSP